MTKDWRRGECIDQTVVCPLLGLLPVSVNPSRLPPVLHPLHQVVERLGNSGEPKYEPPVEVAKSQKDLDVSISLRGVVLPGPDGFYPPQTYREDRKSTRLNSSHTVISYAVFCLKKKKK